MTERIVQPAENLSFSKSLYINKQRRKTLEANFTFTQTGFLFQDLARVICLIDVRFDKAASDWITLQEENSSCKFGALQGIKVVRAGSYHTRPENQANDFEKV